MPSGSRKSLSKIDFELIKLELSLAIDTFQKQFALMIQGISILVVGNITVCGYAATTQSSGIFFIGALLSLGILFSVYRGSRIMLPSLYTAIFVETTYGNSKIDWLASTFTLATLSKSTMDDLRKIIDDKNQDLRIEKLKKIKVPIFGSGKGYIRLALVTGIILQFTLPFILTNYFSWKLF